MHIDWSIPIGTVLLVAAQFVVGIVGLMRAFAAIEKSIDKRFSEMQLALNTFKEGDIRDVVGRLLRLESGQDEWTKALRARTHDQGNDINAMRLQIDRLERPERYGRRDVDIARRDSDPA
jgi:hypothetical protein